MSKRVCIIGGTGFVGRVIARQAIDAGHQVTVTTRHPARARDMLVSGVHIKTVDIVSGKGLDDAVQGSDCVINLVGLLFESGRNTFEAVHTKGAEKVVAACKQANVKQLLHMSALLSNDAIQSSAYARTKHQAEEIVKQSGLDWTIFRPSIIFGEHDSFLNRFKSLSAFGPFLPVIAGDTKFQPIWVEDVARAFVLSIGNPANVQQSYDLAGPDTHTLKEMLCLWMKALHRKRIFLPVPNFMASLLALVSKLLPTPLITADQLILLQYDNVAKGEAYPAQFGKPSPFAALLPVLAHGSQAELLQQRLNNARTHYRNS